MRLVGALAGPSELERHRSGAVPEPQLVGIDDVPVARVSRGEQEVDERGERASPRGVLAHVGIGSVRTNRSLGLPGASVPAALGMR